MCCRVEPYALSRYSPVTLTGWPLPPPRTLLFTGGVNFHYVNQLITSQTGSGIQHHPKYLTVFFLKLFLVLCLLTLFLYTVLFKSDDASEDKEESYEAIPFQRAALWIGFFIILCAAAMKHLHQ